MSLAAEMEDWGCGWDCEYCHNAPPTSDSRCQVMEDGLDMTALMEYLPQQPSEQHIYEAHGRDMVRDLLYLQERSGTRPTHEPCLEKDRRSICSTNLEFCARVRWIPGRIWRPFCAILLLFCFMFIVLRCREEKIDC